MRKRKRKRKNFTRGKRYPDQCQPTQIPPPVAAEVVKRLVLTTSADLRGPYIEKIKKCMDTIERKTGEHGAQIILIIMIIILLLIIQQHTKLNLKRSLLTFSFGPQTSVPNYENAKTILATSAR